MKKDVKGEMKLNDKLYKPKKKNAENAEQSQLSLNQNSMITGAKSAHLEKEE